MPGGRCHFKPQRPAPARSISGRTAGSSRAPRKPGRLHAVPRTGWRGRAPDSGLHVAAPGTRPGGLPATTHRDHYPSDRCHRGLPRPCGPSHTVTSGSSASSILGPTPSTASSSSTFLKGPCSLRQSTMRWARTGPTFGKASSSSTPAVLRLIFPSADVPPRHRHRHLAAPPARRPDLLPFQRNVDLLAVLHGEGQVEAVQVSSGRAASGSRDGLVHPAACRQMHHARPCHCPGHMDHYRSGGSAAAGLAGRFSGTSRLALVPCGGAFRRGAAGAGAAERQDLRAARCQPATRTMPPPQQKGCPAAQRGAGPPASGARAPLLPAAGSVSCPEPADAEYGEAPGGSPAGPRYSKGLSPTPSRSRPAGASPRAACRRFLAWRAEPPAAPASRRDIAPR